MAELKDALVHREDEDGWTGFGYPCPDCAVVFLEEYLLDKHECPVEFHAACGMATQRSPCWGSLVRSVQPGVARMSEVYQGCPKCCAFPFPGATHVDDCPNKEVAEKSPESPPKPRRAPEGPETRSPDSDAEKG
jgi:hypothetical protein